MNGNLIRRFETAVEDLEAVVYECVGKMSVHKPNGPRDTAAVANALEVEHLDPGTELCRALIDAVLQFPEPELRFPEED